MYISIIENAINDLFVSLNEEIISFKNTENSMSFAKFLPEKLSALREYYTIRWKELGGTNAILKIIEDEIVKRIDQLEGEGAGEKARQNINNRLGRYEVDGEIGTLHSALRLLLDEDNLDATSFPSLLHKNSTATYNGTNIREIVSFFATAALDGDMPIADKYK